VELKSDDPKVVAAYLRSNFKAFELKDYDDFAEKWIGSGRWNRTAMVHCNMYHSLSGKIAIMGDAAHATSPSIGMGMNTALRDAQKFYELLHEYNDDLDQVLPAYSKLRVKEGNSLTDLAFNLYCLDTNAQMIEIIHMVVRSFLSTWVPWISQHPQAMIGNPNHTLSEVYTLATQVGIIPKHRAINDRIRQQHYEKQTGMITEEKKTSLVWTGLALALVGVVAVILLTSGRGEAIIQYLK
jgi:flavin-dependent dehydrogenase